MYKISSFLIEICIFPINYKGAEYTPGSNNVKWQSKKINKKKNPLCDIDVELVGLKLTSKSTSKISEKIASMPNDIKDNSHNFNDVEFQQQQHQLRKNKSLHAVKIEQRQQDNSQFDNNVVTMEQNLLCQSIGNDGTYMNIVPHTMSTTKISGAAFFPTPALIDEKSKVMEKKCRNVMKKLQDIQKLKARQEQGEVLQLNQLQKIASEPKLMDELRSLEKSA